MTIEQIPNIEDYSKNKGIKGLIQIANKVRDENTIPQRIEVITRYFSKLQARMEKAGTPISIEEEEKIRSTLMEIVTKDKL